MVLQDIHTLELEHQVETKMQTNTSAELQLLLTRGSISIYFSCDNVSNCVSMTAGVMCCASDTAQQHKGMNMMVQQELEQQVSDPGQRDCL